MEEGKASVRIQVHPCFFFERLLVLRPVVLRRLEQARTRIRPRALIALVLAGATRCPFCLLSLYPALTPSPEGHDERGTEAAEGGSYPHCPLAALGPLPEP